MYRTLHLLRNRYRFNGYIHVKAIPGAPAELIEKTGYLADRMSVNLELPTGEGLQKLAPQKTQKAILKPMRQIQSGIVDYRLTAGKSAFLERSSGNRYLSNSIFDTRKQISASAADLGWISSSSARSLPEKERSAPFVPAGQSTQMIIGATKENDYQLLSTSQLLYQQYDLKRVFYSAYIPVYSAVLISTGNSSHLSFEHLKKIGVVLKRAKYFITCEGKMMYHMRLEQQFLTRQLTGEEAASNWEVSHPEQYQQLSLFDAAVPGHI